LNLLVEIRFKELEYQQILKAYRCATSRFKEELRQRKIKYQRLEVFFSTQRLILWLRLGKGEEQLAQELTASLKLLLEHIQDSLPEIWVEITGLVPLLGDKVLPVATTNLNVGTDTRVGERRVSIKDTQHYWREMGRLKVIIDNGQREKHIRQMLADAAYQAGGEVISSELMNEIVVGAEQPVAKTIIIPMELFSLPEKLLMIILKKNRCFGIQSDRGLLNTAIHICNDGCITPDLEKVMAQAQQAYQADMRIPISQRQKLLESLVYSRGLGNYIEKQKRLEKIVLTIADGIDAGESVCNVARSASQIAKIDKTTKICEQYPEFRGHMGAEIAKRHGAEEMVAAAIIEHLCPGQHSQQLPHTLVGALLGVADRVDDICGLYYQADFKLSNLRNVKTWFDEIIIIMDSVPLDISMRRLLKFSLSLYESQGLVPWREKDLVSLLKVFTDRLYYYILDREYAQGIAASLAAIEPDNVFCTMQKADLMTGPSYSQEVENCAEACKILDRICAKEYNYEEAAREFLEEPEEKDLFEVYLVARDDIRESEEARDHKDILFRLAKLKTPLLRCVNAVDLDTEDRPVRFNRLSLLAEIRSLYHVFADFSLI